MKPALLTLLLTLSASLSFGQTSADIETRYGRPLNSYSVTEFVWMTPEYAADGQVCRMRLYPKRVSGNTNIFIKELPFDDYKTVVDQLVPIETRGPKKQTSDGGWVTGGGSIWATFTYEKVRITYSAGFSMKYDGEVLKRGEFVFSIPPGTESLPPSNDEYLLFHDSKVEMVTISWLERKCSAD
jgi:hypothetical protein